MCCFLSFSNQLYYKMFYYKCHGVLGLRDLALCMGRFASSEKQRLPGGPVVKEHCATLRGHGFDPV